MVDDTARGQVVLVRSESGASTLSTWTWDGHTWTHRVPSVSPPAGGFDIAYDPGAHNVVLRVSVQPDPNPGFSVPWPFCLPTQTWTWDGTTWTRAFSSTMSYTGPRDAPAGLGGAFGYDPVSGRLLHFGGSCETEQGYAIVGDTWAWTGTAWSQLTPAHTPPPMAWPASGQDPVTGRLLLFGGCPNVTCTNDYNQTWTWNGSDWAQLTPPTSPSPRTSAVAADRATNQLVLFGGTDGDVTFDDTWTWNGTTWTQLHPATSPSTRDAASLAQDPVTGHPLLVGGFDFKGGTFTDTWTFAPPQPEITAPSAPRQVLASPRNRSAAISWKAPASNGGSPVTRYTVTAQPGARHCTTSGAPGCSITGLVNGMAYTFTVTATSLAGTSPSSSRTMAIIVGTPTQPRLTTLSHPRAGATAIAWKAPAFIGGGEILRYIVRVSGTAGRTWSRWTSTGTNRAIGLHGLRRGHRYVVQVRAVNRYGSGLPLVFSFPQTR